MPHTDTLLFLYHHHVYYTRYCWITTTTSSSSPPSALLSLPHSAYMFSSTKWVHNIIIIIEWHKRVLFNIQHTQTLGNAKNAQYSCVYYDEMRIFACVCLIVLSVSMYTRTVVANFTLWCTYEQCQGCFWEGHWKFVSLSQKVVSLKRRTRSHWIQGNDSEVKDS